MTDWVVNIVETLGYPGIVFLMFLENVFPPIPSELIMPLAGYTSGRGRLSFPGVVAAGTLGSVLGAIPLYYLGSAVGEQRLIAWADRHGRLLRVSGGDIERADSWFDRHGGKVVFFGRLVPGVRSLISIPAGVARMNLVPFLLYTALGASLWTALLAYAGRVLGENYVRVGDYLGPASYVVLAGLSAALALWLWRRRRDPRESAGR